MVIGALFPTAFTHTRFTSFCSPQSIHIDYFRVTIEGRATVAKVLRGQKYRYFFVQPLRNMGSLEVLIPSLKKNAATTANAKLILVQILIGLGEMHAANFIHRDIKPANILVENTKLVSAEEKTLPNLPIRVYVADLGLAGTALTGVAPGKRVADYGGGTPGYIPKVRPCVCVCVCVSVRACVSGVLP